MDIFEYDKQEGVELLCGVDEAGRGPLAGDVYAAAVILPTDCYIEGLNDSKKLSEKKREELYDIIIEKAIAYGVGIATIEEIDENNILNATFIAMKRAVEKLSVKPKLVLVDGNRNPQLDIHTRLVVKGDATSACIAAASIIAKVTRDRYMKEIAENYPQYQFEKHKGYGTDLHYKMLDQFGISDIHRKSFLKKYLSGEKNTRQIRGEVGEKTTIEYLISKGYNIVEKNFHSAYGEIDIIAMKDNVITFVEVKARKFGGVATAKEAVTKSKQTKIIKTTAMYLKDKKGFERYYKRFDVVEVYFDKNNNIVEINHIENAFRGDGLNIFI